MASELVEYDKACRALARAASVDEVLKIRDKAEQIRLYAKQAKNRQAEADAWDIRTRAERKLGVEMEDRKEDRAAVGRPKKRDSENPLPTLEANGVDKNLANRARRLGGLSESDFGKYRIDGRKQIERHVEKEIRKQSKPKVRKVKPPREYECPHCGKPVYLKAGRLEK